MTPDQRHRLYALLSRIWVKELDEDAVAVLRGSLGRELFPAFSASKEAEALTDPDRRAAAFDADFTHLTVVNLVPYESFFRRDDGMLEAGAVNPVATFLQRYGFEVDLAAARSLAPDHLGIELEVMSVLCAREAEAFAADNGPAGRAVRRVQREFLEQHTLTWAPMYLFAAVRNARTLLYREAAEATLQFLFADHEALVAAGGAP